MTIETIRIELIRSEGALIRVLGLIERRGFSVQGITMPPAMPGANSRLVHIAATVEARQPGRSAANLTAQLRKLWDVQQVMLTDETNSGTETTPVSTPPDREVTVSCAV